MSGSDLSVAGPSRAHATTAAEPSSDPFHFRDKFRFIPGYVLSDSFFVLFAPTSLPSFGIPLFRPSTPHANGDARRC
ncbi:hypothetical protein EUGRSUZ_G00837 [Eucalyptus grandis]|uniref:Uncharacterized protein n=2 Tax=Eucalyptus grandis TaxID=71139 RepID=A0ACC3K162_EUCGR|nr:hypothetical protein EUGRSUZ_G00837 [Eucalyptus grandis]